MKQQYQMFSVLCLTQCVFLKKKIIMVSLSVALCFSVYPLSYSIFFLYRFENCAIQSSLPERKAPLRSLLSKSVCGVTTTLHFLCQNKGAFVHEEKKNVVTTLTGTKCPFENVLNQKSFMDTRHTVLWHRCGFSRQCFHSCIVLRPPFDFSLF